MRTGRESSSRPALLSRSGPQELCAEAPSVPPEELGEDEGEARDAEERGGEGAGRQQLVHLHSLGRSHPRRRQH